MNYTNKDIQFYLKKRIRPQVPLRYLSKYPKLLNKFKNKQNILCEVHGNHSDWELRDKGTVYSKYPALRCKPCNTLATLYWHHTRKIKSLYKDAKQHAKTGGFKFEIERSDIFNQLKKQKMRCNLSNIKFDREKNFPSIDKIDPNKGYTKKNIQFLTYQINRMKNKFDQKHFIDLVAKIYDFKILKKGKYSHPVYNFDYQRDLLLGLSTKEGNKLKIKRLLNNQDIYCKKHGWHKQFRFRNKKFKDFVKCKKCEAENSLIYKSKIRNDPNYISNEKKTKAKRIENFLKFKKATCEIHGTGSFFRYRKTKYKHNGKIKFAESISCRKCDNEYGIKDRLNNPLKWCFLGRKSERRKSVSKRFHIKYEDILLQYEKQNGRCFYTGIPLDKKKNRPSLERKNNEVDYTKENVVITTMDSNQSKTDLSYEDFIKNIKSIYNFYNKKIS